MKLGNTDFRNGLCKKLSLAKFTALYAGKLKGIDIREAYIKLGGKLKAPK